MEIVAPGDTAELRQALALLLARGDASPADMKRQIESLVAYIEENKLSLNNCLLARESGRTEAVCLCLDYPGRISTIILPPPDLLPRAAASLDLLLNEAARRAGERDIQLLQGMVPPEAGREAAVFRQAGFEHLARLIYLECDLMAAALPMRPAPVLSWEIAGPQTRALLARVVAGTYVDSLDCGSLNGLRDIEDILASHRATGRFDPRFWLMGFVGGEPVGVLLMAHVPQRWCFEIAYLGLLPAWRGKGYGSALLRRAVDVAREEAVATLTLSVDVRNTPARKLYERFGFRESSRRDAWIRILSSRISASRDTPHPA